MFGAPEASRRVAGGALAGVPEVQVLHAAGAAQPPDGGGNGADGQRQADADDGPGPDREAGGDGRADHDPRAVEAAAIPLPRDEWGGALP